MAGLEVELGGLKGWAWAEDERKRWTTCIGEIG